MQKSAIFVKKSLKNNMLKRYSHKIYRKVRDHCHYTVIIQVNIEVLHIAHVTENIVYLNKPP